MQGITCYLVGGWLRDQLLASPPRHLNVDLAVERGAIAFARHLAQALGGAFVPLDDEHGCARVVVASPAAPIELDVGDFRGRTLDDDLRARDFTINAMAMPLEAWLRCPEPPAPLIDPLQGAEAIRSRRLIPCFPGTFREDPVRILRAVRFVAQLDFALDPAALPLMSDAAPLLSRVSVERLRDELLAALDTDRASGAVRSLNEVGALDVLFPELIPGRGLDQGPFHHLDVLGHQVETVVQADRFLAEFAEFSLPLREPLARYCAEELVPRHSRKALIKLSGLLHDVGKPVRRTVEPDGEIWFLGHEHTGAELTAGIVQRLRLSNREAEMVHQLVLHHLRPGFLSREPQLTRRAVYRFFKELGDHGPGCLLTWWADRMATRGSRSRLDQLDQQRGRLEELLNAYFFQAEEVVKPPRLLDGRQLMRTFQLKPGPLIGELLGAIEEAQAEGRIHTSDDALALARTLVEQQNT
ncbi:MAG: HD domain-containing protein [Candidatus Omnitrophica bacterium]|nr:HD domain-containing protein [Candidatus Omnitrophota bacterium]